MTRLDRKRHDLRAAACLLPLMLAGCGGGGGGVASMPAPVSSTTPATPTPTPSMSTPTPTPTVVAPVVNYDDAEYQRSNAATAAGALAAYKAGASGAGVTMAIIDTGITAVGSEFDGRIAAASRGFAGDTSVTDVDGHGTAIAGVAAAGRNGSDIQGIAYGATVLALRASTPGSCGTSDGCKFSDTTLTTAIDYARTNGARVINLSLGGSGASPQLIAAVARATAAGIIVVVSAGNDGTASPDAFAQAVAGAGSNGLVVIAGSHDATGTISSFSGKAGSFGQTYIAALGERVRSFNEKGEALLYSGTSFSAPAIASAVALLEQAFPNMTPAQVVDLIYRSATDAGASGVDAVYGRGLLNIARAFQPIGTTSLAGSTVAVNANEPVALSPAMGDAGVGTASLGSAVIVDGYGRAFAMPIGAQVVRTAAARPLADGLRGGLLTRSVDLPGMSVSTTVAQRFGGALRGDLTDLGSAFANDRARPRSAAIVARLGGGASGIAMGESAATLGRRLDGEATGAGFVAALAPDTTPGFAASPDLAMALRRRIGRLAITGSAERGRMARLSARDWQAPGYTQTRIAAERRWGPLRLTAGLAVLREDGAVLGARLGAMLGGTGATTRYLDGNTTLALGNGWMASGAIRRGWTRSDTGALAAARLRTSAAALGVTRERAASRIGLRVALPTRVTSGGLALTAPVAYDYASGTVGYASRFVGLSPTGRERDVEADAGVRLGDGWLESNLFWRAQPGNVAAAPDDLGIGLRYALTF